jgi:hypothetical protein
MVSTEEYDDQAVVEAHIRRLSDEECTAFVADLWESRGYETHSDRGLISAVRGGESLTIGVGDIGDETVDILVATDGSGREATGTRLVDAAGLAERLWYAVDRQAARTLCQTHLGAPPEDLRPPLGMVLRRRVPTTPGVVLPAAAVVVLVAVAVVALGAAGLPGSDDSPTAGDDPSTSTIDAGPPVETQSMPPGVSEVGIRDIDALAGAHRRAVDDRAVTIWVDRDVPVFARDGWDIRTYDMDVASNGEQYLIDMSTGPRGNRTDLGALYHDGENSFARVVDDGDVRYQAISPAQQEQSVVPSPSGLAARIVTRYLSTPRTELAGTVVRNGVTYYRVVATGSPATASLESAENYSATAEISTRGFVRNLTVEYTDTSRDRGLRLRREVTYARMNETTVTEPAWYREQFGDTTTPTA